MPTPHVQLIVDDDTAPSAPLRTALNRVNARVSIRSLDRALASGISPSADLCVVLPSAKRSSDVLTHFLDETSNSVCATLVIPADGRVRASDEFRATPALGERHLLPAPRPATASLNADELTGRIQALCEIRHPMRKMRDEITRLRRANGQQADIRGELDEQLKLAGQIQNDLLPRPITDAGPLAISTLYVPADFVSGDTYDIARLDEERLGLSIADASGHGLPAALLAILAKNSLRGKEINNGSYRIIEPDELLMRLNQDLLATHLQQCHFITALYAIFDRTTCDIRWARGGTPYPILFRPGQAPRQMRTAGGLIGAFEDQTFEIARHKLDAGDTLLFYTDGLEAALIERNDTRGEEAILNTDWVCQFTSNGPDASFEQIRTLVANRPPADWLRDDITAIAIQIHG